MFSQLSFPAMFQEGCGSLTELNVMARLHQAAMLPDEPGLRFCWPRNKFNPSFVSFPYLICRNGYLGRAYRTCQEGDEVWLLAGCRTPVILRPSGGDYRYIAPAYFDDMMHGELWPENEEELEVLNLVWSILSVLKRSNGNFFASQNYSSYLVKVEKLIWEIFHPYSTRSKVCTLCVFQTKKYNIRGFQHNHLVIVI